ncbi:hypothetical protein [Pseudoalteromonas sp. PS5]|uniref:hypothetical protein n=1 Tax=Pseudoalteromonas sp. PS5 TaxID=1437473 RepID=UPI000FFF36D1|nr:hypothetical protein [Pseudoalteromonas sp. PS5]RXF00412.1 hypothetical protein D9603_15315 [Pseudoalteromonas sp. PS5]
MKQKELEMKLEQKEAQLERAIAESESWNRGKYKTSSNAEISKIYVKSLRKEVNELSEMLSKMKSQERT